MRMYKDSGLDSKGIKEMMNQADTDGDGEIDVDEFKVRVGGRENVADSGWHTERESVCVAHCA